jgi:MFS family permease
MDMKRNVGLLATCQALMMTANVLLIATSALVGQRLAAIQGLSESLATLPLMAQFLATMLTTIPASLLMKRIGRRAGFLLGSSAGLAGGTLATYGILQDNFVLFSLATALFGINNGFGTYYRFAAADSATPDYRATAISYVMAGGVVAALIGTDLANWTRDLWVSAPFAGSYFVLVGLYTLSLLALAFIRIPREDTRTQSHSGRPLREIIAQKTFIVAVVAAMFGYGVMSLIMTATPLAMRAHAHNFSSTAFVIEWHVVGMFAPSFFTGHLIRHLGVVNVLLAGALLYAMTIAINLTGTSETHFWLALFMLGIGWNFLYIGGTTLLTETYDEQEKAKVQALNDFLIYTTVVGATLTAGVLQHAFGWRMVNFGVLPLITLILIAVLWLKRSHCCETIVL